jgi:serine/threonine protein kinase
MTDHGQFPITALREIKLLKLLSHPNVLRLEDMAVEHPPKGMLLTFRSHQIEQPY